MEVFGGFFKFLLVYFTSFRVKPFSSVVFHQYPCFGVLSNGFYVSIEILLDNGAGGGGQGAGIISPGKAVVSP